VTQWWSLLMLLPLACWFYLKSCLHSWPQDEFQESYSIIRHSIFPSRGRKKLSLYVPPFGEWETLPSQQSPNSLSSLLTGKPIPNQ
jgi:hypothetical protein